MNSGLNKSADGRLLYPMISAGPHTSRRSFSSSEEAVKWAEANVPKSVVWEVIYTHRAPRDGSIPLPDLEERMRRFWRDIAARDRRVNLFQATQTARTELRDWFAKHGVTLSDIVDECPAGCDDRAVCDARGHCIKAAVPD